MSSAVKPTRPGEATTSMVQWAATRARTALLIVYFCESIMFPTIFALALRGLGRRTKIASSLLIMGIVGGAVAPVLMGLIADHSSMAYGFIVPLVCFFIIAAYGGFVVRRSARAQHRH